MTKARSNDAFVMLKHRTTQNGLTSADRSAARESDSLHSRRDGESLLPVPYSSTVVVAVVLSGGIGSFQIVVRSLKS